MTQSIDRLLEEARRRARRRTGFNRKKPINLKYVTEEPDGWPLTRPATKLEWAHVVKVLIMRRVPEGGPIHRDKLIKLAQSDLIATSEKGLIYVDPYFPAMRRVYMLVSEMITKDKTLRTAGDMEDPEMRRAPAVYRTEYAEGWLSRVPAIVQAVVDFMPTTNVLDLLVQSLIDAE